MNQNVFGSEMIFFTFIVGIIELLFLFIHLGVIISKPYNISNWRFLLLISLFVFYNLCSGLFPDSNIFIINQLIQNTLAFGSGIALASYFFYFLIKEIEINQRKFFNVKFLVFSLCVSFLTLYVLSYLFYEDFEFSKRLFIIPPVIIALYFCYNTIRSIQVVTTSVPKLRTYRKINLTGNLGITFMSTMPIVVLIGDFQMINIGLVNVSFFLILYSFYSLLVIQAKNERELKKDQNNTSNVLNITEIGLSPRQLEVASNILKGKNYKDLADEMYINHKTVSKHASNIFKKANCSNREEFMAKFLKHDIYRVKSGYT